MEDTAVTDSEGRITFNVDTTGQEGTATVELTYAGDDTYSNATATDNVEIKPAKQAVIIALTPDESYPIDEDMELSGEVFVDDDDSTPVAGQTVNVVVKFDDDSEVEYSNVTDVNGSFTIVIPSSDLKEGPVEITVTMDETDEYLEASTTAETEIIAQEQKPTAIFFEPDTPITTGEMLVVDAELDYLNDDDEYVPLENTISEYINLNLTVEVKLGDEVLDIKDDLYTDGDGHILFKFNTTGVVGNLTVTITSKETDEYAQSSEVYTVEVLPEDIIPTDIGLHVQLPGIPEEIENGTVLDQGTTVIIEGNLTDKDGNPIKDVDININYTIVLKHEDGTLETLDEGQVNVDEDIGEWVLDDLDLETPGEVTITVFFEGNDKYAASDIESRHFTVGVVEPVIVIEATPNPAVAGQEVTVRATLINNKTGEVLTDGYLNLIVKDPEEEQVAIINGEAPEGYIELTFTPATHGNFTITANDDTYLIGNESTLVVTKPEVETEFVDLTYPEELFDGKESTVEGTLQTVDGTPLAEQPITVTVTNDDGLEETYEGVTDSEGKFSIPINPDTIGPVTITVSYPGSEEEDAIYKPASDSEDTEIVPVDYEVTLDELEDVYDYNTTVPITGKVTSNYEPLDIDEITIEINGKPVTVPVNEDGTFTYEFPGDTAGDYEVVAIVNDDTKSEPQTFTIDKMLVEVTLEVPTETVFIGDDEAVITGTVVEMDTREPIANAPVTIIVNGEEVGQTTTDDQGKYTYDISDKLVNGTNNVTVIADATDNYDADDVNDTIDAILRQNLTIEVITPSDDLKINDSITVVVITSSNGTIVKVDSLNYTYKGGEPEEIPMTGTHGEYTLTSDVNGTFTLNVSRAQDDLYNYAENITNITFRNLNTAIESNDNSIQEAKAFDEIDLSVNVVDENGNPVGKGTVEFTYDGQVIGTANVTDGTATIKTKFNDSGRKNVTVKFTSEDTYEASSSDYTVVAIIDEATTNLTVDPIDDIEVGKPTNVTGKVTDEEGNPIAGVPVSVKVGDQVVNGTTDEDGKFSIPVTPEDANVDEVTVSVPAKDGYAPAEETVPVDIEKQDANLTVDPIDDLEAGKETPVTGTVTDDNGEPVANAPVTVKVGDKTYTGTTDEDGKFSIPVTPEESGETPVEVSVGETDKTKPANKTTTANVDKQDANLTVDPIKNAEAGKEVPVTGKVTDEEGKPVAGAPVTVKVGDKEYTGNTDQDGKFSIPVTPETSGKQPVEVSVGETDTTKPANKTTNANVAKQDAKVTVDPIADAKAGKEVPVTGKVTDEQGNPVANAPVNVTVDGKTYTGTTDEDGNYNIPVTPTKEGNLPVNVSVGPTNKTNGAKANTTAKVTKQEPTVTVDPVSDAEVGKPTNVTGKVTDEEGKPVAGAPVSVKVGDKTYNGTTDKDGKFSIPVTPEESGSTPVQVTVGATNTTKAKTVNDSITASKVATKLTVTAPKSVTVGDKYAINGTLKDADNKAIANAPVSINVDGKKLSATTDSKGKFTVNATAADVGKEEVTAVYAGDAKYEASNVANATVTVTKLGTKTTINAINGKALNNVTITANVKDTKGNAVKVGQVYFTDDTGVIGLANVTNGKATVTTSYPEAFNGSVSAQYLGADNYTSSSANRKANISKLNVFIKADPITGQQNDIVTITAKITDENGNPVQSGNVAFKINGQSLKDENGTPVKVKVDNGTISVNVNATQAWKGNSTLIIRYLGDNTYNAANNTTKANIGPRKAELKLITDKIARGGDQIVLTAVVTDNGESVNGGQVLFKVNGETIKDASGKPILANVVNGTASIVYDIRPGMSAKDLNMTAVLSNKLYDRTENYTILTIVRSDVYFNTSLVYAKDGKAHIQATLRDAHGELCVYNTDIALKVGGKTQLSKAINGIIDCEIDTSFLKPGVWELYYVAGLNNRYNEVRMTNALIVE